MPRGRRSVAAEIKPHRGKKIGRQTVSEPCRPVGLAVTVGDAAGAVARICTFHRRTGGRPLDIATNLITGRGWPESQAILTNLSPPWRDHAIACAYAALMPQAEKKRLGAYFTPPHLVDHLLGRLEAFGARIEADCFRDPAAGGAAFVVPLARRMVGAWLRDGLSRRAAAARLVERLVGTEIDRHLVGLARALLERMLRDEFRFPARLAARATAVIGHGDGLAPSGRRISHEVGNPPYRRLTKEEGVLAKRRFADIAGGRLNLYAVFTRSALDYVPPGGLVGHVIPASFVGGPEFAMFRRRISQLAEVLVLDVVEKRTDVFLDAIQDACFVVLRRRVEPVDDPPPHHALSAVLTAEGGLLNRSTLILSSDGSPWSLPSKVEPGAGASLAELGWRPRVGHLVANRERGRLHRRAARGRYPLLWAAAIRPDGGFDFDRGRLSRQAGGLGYVQAAADAAYVIREECIVLQRTSSRSQGRRLTAGIVPKSFINRHGGVVGENHVILLVRTRPDAASAAEVATLLNSSAASETYARVGGSVSISARVLAELHFPIVDRALRQGGDQSSEQQHCTSLRGAATERAE